MHLPRVAHGLALQHCHVWLVQPPLTLPLLRERAWRVVCLAACKATQSGHRMSWKLVSQPQPRRCCPRLWRRLRSERGGGL